MTHKTMLFNKGLQPLVLVLFLAASLFATVPRIMNYQGKLTDASGVALSGIHPITFYILKNSDPSTDSSGDTLWGETLNVDITNGLFDVTLGNIHPINLDFSVPYYMELVVDGETMSPREKLAPVSFAYRAIYADTADTVLKGDNWGTQVVQHDVSLSGNGTSSAPLSVASAGDGCPNSCFSNFIKSFYITRGKTAPTSGSDLVDSNTIFTVDPSETLYITLVNLSVQPWRGSATDHAGTITSFIRAGNDSIACAGAVSRYGGGSSGNTISINYNPPLRIAPNTDVKCLIIRAYGFYSSGTYYFNGCKIAGSIIGYTNP